MNLSNNGGQRVPASPNEASSTKNKLHLIKLVAEEKPWNPQTTHVIANATGCSTQTYNLAILLKITPMQDIVH